MDFPPRGGSRGRGDEDLDIDFAPLRPEREAPRERPERRRAGQRRRARREAPDPGPRRRRGPSSETVARVLWAVPWIVFAVAVVAVGGIVFAIAMGALACIGMAELFRVTSDLHPFRLVAFAVGIGLIVAAYYGGQFQMTYVVAAAFPLMFVASAARSER